MRMFASLIPPRPALDDLEATLTDLLAGASDAPKEPSAAEATTLRWVPTHQRHITLAFHGEVLDEAAERLREDLAGIAAATPRLTLRLAGSGVFSERVVWTGVESRDVTTAARDPLVELMIACREAIAHRPGRTQSPENREHGDAGVAASPADAAGPAEGARPGPSSADDPVPHLTLARAARRGTSGPSLQRLAAGLADYAGPEWTAGELLLMRSQLGAGPRGSAHHTMVAELPLTGDPGHGAHPPSAPSST